MKHKIRHKADGIEIQISDIDNKQAELLQSFQLCQQGKCDCPTDEYKKLQAIEIASSKDEIVLNLKAKANEVLNRSEIEKCIAFTAKKVNQMPDNADGDAK